MSGFLVKTSSPSDLDNVIRQVEIIDVGRPRVVRPSSSKRRLHKRPVAYSEGPTIS